MERTANSTSLTGQVALITGGGRGIGRATALELARAGAAVAVLARSADQLHDTVDQIMRLGGRALACPADVRERPAVEQAVAQVEQQLGPVDLLVNSAGMGKPVGPLAEIDPEDWWRGLEVNLRGPLLCSRVVLPGMRARRRGRIINVTSGAGTQAIAFLSAYVVSKTALIRLTENLAAEVEEDGVQVFAIHPGTVRTAMTEEALQSAEVRKWLPWFGASLAQGRDVPPERAARLVRWLASGAADMLTGRFLDVMQDVEALAAQADQVRRQDLYVLRLRTSEQMKENADP